MNRQPLLPPMENLKKALKSILSGGFSISDISDIAHILFLFLRKERVDYEEVATVVSGSVDETLLALWEWKFVIPVRSSQCSEWDFRILMAESGEYYEMPNISKSLIQKGVETGRWDSFAAILDLFQKIGEPEWEKIPELVLSIKKDTIHNTINATKIRAACTRCGLREKTGAMIAVLKGAGIISPKMAAVSPVAKSRSPVYEFNPSVYAELLPNSL